MSWGDDYFDKAKNEHGLARKVQEIVGLLNGAQDQPGFEEARPFLEQACEELQMLLYADQDRQEIMDLRQRAGVVIDDEEPPLV